jgi:hyperosmotically inducible protein
MQCLHAKKALKGIDMKNTLIAGFTGLILTFSSGCSSTPKAPDVAEGIRQSLKGSGLNDVSVSQDRDKGVVTLSGHVPAESDKERADSIAKSQATGQVVANQIAVLPPGGEKDAKNINSDLDKAIEKNVDAAFIQAGLKSDVRFDVKQGVVTLTGSVNSQTRRADAARIAGTVPNVRQVVNDVQVKNQRATSSR